MSTTSPLEYETRIRALERINATLATEVDLMQKVVDAAKTWHGNDKGFTRIHLHNAVSHYITAKMTGKAHGS